MRSTFECSIAADVLSHVVGLRTAAFVTPLGIGSFLDRSVAANGLSDVVGLRAAAFVTPVRIGSI